MKSPTKADKKKKAARDKVHSQKRLAERRCVTGHIVRHPDRRSTRAAPRGRLLGRGVSHPSRYDKLHQRKKIYALRDTSERQAAAKKLLDDRQRGMMKGYWSYFQDAP